MKNKLGFSTIELLVSFIIVTLLSITMFRVVVNLNSQLKIYQNTSNIVVFNGNVTNNVEKDLLNHTVASINACGSNCFDFVYSDIGTKRLKISSTDKTLQYGNVVETLPNNTSFDGNISINMQTVTANLTSDYNAILTITIPISSVFLTSDQNIKIVFQYDTNKENFAVTGIPTITLVGSNSVTINRGSTYTDLGATAHDDKDGTLTSSIVTTSNVNTSTAGTYYVNYNVTDSDGNNAAQVTRTVTVVIPPNDTTGASAPQLASNMIPVMYNGTNWVKADASNPSGSAYAWYNYASKQWANAVTVTSSKLSTYQSAALGTTIPESDILTYLVWIPRYSYYITTGGTSTPSTIQIKFESSSTTKSTGNATSTYLTNPAFTFGAKELNGIWVGKFEASVNTASSCYTSESVANCNLSTLTPLSKPNVKSWRYAQVVNYFTAMQNMTASSNIYGFNSSEVDAHMMKNIEWGAVAYLSASTYGKTGEVWINPNQNYLTGQAGTSVSASVTTTTYNYNDATYGVNASTTGTIYGVYDMSGGSWEYVMGNYNNYSGRLIDTNSGFNGPTGGDSKTFTTGIAFPNAKYYNLFTTGTATTACSGGICYGQALSETSNWYSDGKDMVSANYPWLMRGGCDTGTTSAGVFDFTYYDGYAYVAWGARFVVTPNN